MTYTNARNTAFRMTDNLDGFPMLPFENSTMFLKLDKKNNFNIRYNISIFVSLIGIYACYSRFFYIVYCV